MKLYCDNCGKERKYGSKSLCWDCHCHAGFCRKKKIICKQCGIETYKVGLDLCRKCWNKQYKQRPEVKERTNKLRREDRIKNHEKHLARDHERDKSTKRKIQKKKNSWDWYQRNREHVLEYQRNYRKSDITRQTIYKSRRRARVMSLPCDLTNNDWQNILIQYNHSCFYCGETNPILRMEHKIPVIKGGGFTKDNIVPACERCNYRKRSMTIDEFREHLIILGEIPKF